MIVNCINIGKISSEEYEFFKKRISKERRKRADSFRFVNDAYRCVFAEVLLKYSLYEVFCKDIEIDLVYNKYGKPRMKNIEDFFLIFHIQEIGLYLHLGKKRLALTSKKYSLRKCLSLIVS